MERLKEYFDINGRIIVEPAINIAIITIILLLAVRLITWLFKRFSKRLLEAGKSDDVGYLNFFRYLVLAVVYLVCFSCFAYQIPSLSTLVTSLLAGSGILAIVVGLASQSALGDIISGILIAVFRPFKVGDWVKCMSLDTEGEIEEITLRHTVIRTIQNKRIIVPNRLMSDNVIENSNFRDDKICMLIDLTVTHDVDVEAAAKILAEAVRRQPNFIDNRSPSDISEGVEDVKTMIYGLDQSGATIRAYAWAPSIGAGYALRSDVYKAVKKEYEKAGITLASSRRLAVNIDNIKGEDA